MDNNEQLKILKSAAEISDFGYGVWAYDKWDDFNQQYFDGALTIGGIFWGLTSHGHALGFFERWRNAITLHTSLVRASTDAWGMGRLLGERLAADVLLHEMIHQYNNQIDKVEAKSRKASESSHNCDAWCNQINRLILLLNIETSLRAVPIGQKRIDGKVQWHVPDGNMTRSQLATFPHSLRPASYYESESRELIKSSGLLN